LSDLKDYQRPFPKRELGRPEGHFLPWWCAHRALGVCHENGLVEREVGGRDEAEKALPPHAEGDPSPPPGAREAVQRVARA
jgi:hypothetical protein